VKLSMKSEALAFRIWQYAAPREWNVTLGEIADHLGESLDRARGVVVAKGWFVRIRAMAASKIEANPRIGQHTSAYSGVGAASRYIAADLASGRIGNGESV
jgi:hypothetical protein